MYSEMIDMDEVQAMLTMAGFSESRSGTWERTFDVKNGVHRYISVQLKDNNPRCVILKLVPSLSDHDYEKHKDVAIMAAMSFKLASIIGERYGATVVHEARVGMCRTATPAGPQNHEMAAYPVKRMEFEDLCLGFQRIMEGGIELELQTS